MTSPDTSSPSVRPGSRWFTLLFFVAIFLLVLTLQWASGAYAAEFSGYPDEPAHYITGLMVEQYFRLGDLSRPVAFAENYYLHYPKVAIGHWPPLLYVLQAIWSLAFGSTTQAILLLQALLMSLCATMVLILFRPFLGAMTAATAAILFVLLPEVQRLSGMWMSEGLLTLCTLLAMAMLLRYCQQGDLLSVYGFASATALAIMTKGSGLTLLVAATGVVLLVQGWQGWLRTRFWLMLGLPITVCLPWLLFTSKMTSNGFESPRITSALAVSYLVEYSQIAPLLLTLSGVAAATLGLFWVIAEGRWRTPFWAHVLMLIAATVFMHTISPTGAEVRRLIMCTPALLALALYGVSTAWSRWISPSRLAPVALFAGLVLLTGFHIPAKTQTGYRLVAQRLTDRIGLKNTVFLVTSQIDGEGQFIAEAANLHPSPAAFILRASKMLTESDWKGMDVRQIVQTREQLLTLLESVPVEFLIVDQFRDTPQSFSHRLMTDLMRDQPKKFELLFTVPSRTAFQSGVIMVYRNTSVSDPHPPNFTIDLSRMIDRKISP